MIEEDMKLLKIDITFNDSIVESSTAISYNDIYNNSSSMPLVHMGIKCCHFIKEKLSEYAIINSSSDVPNNN